MSSALVASLVGNKKVPVRNETVGDDTDELLDCVWRSQFVAGLGCIEENSSDLRYIIEREKIREVAKEK